MYQLRIFALKYVRGNISVERCSVCLGITEKRKFCVIDTLLVYVCSPWFWMGLIFSRWYERWRGWRLYKNVIGLVISISKILLVN